MLFSDDQFNKNKKYLFRSQAMQEKIETIAKSVNFYAINKEN